MPQHVEWVRTLMRLLEKSSFSLVANGASYSRKLATETRMLGLAMGNLSRPASLRELRENASQRPRPRGRRLRGIERDVRPGWNRRAGGDGHHWEEAAIDVIA